MPGVLPREAAGQHIRVVVVVHVSWLPRDGQRKEQRVECPDKRHAQAHYRRMLRPFGPKENSSKMFLE